MSDEIAPVLTKITYAETTKKVQVGNDQERDMVWCGTGWHHKLSRPFLWCRLIFQHQIRHIVGQIEELSVCYGALQSDIAII